MESLPGFISSTEVRLYSDYEARILLIIKAPRAAGPLNLHGSYAWARPDTAHLFAHAQDRICFYINLYKYIYIYTHIGL